MAEELGDDELLGDALNNRGIVRAGLGDPGWQQDSERSVELALRTNSFRGGRAYINLGSNLVDAAADLVRGEAVTREGLAFSQRIGMGEVAIAWVVSNLADMRYLRGDWVEALQLAERVVAGERHYMQQTVLSVRAHIRLARGDASGAAEDAAIALRDARAIRDPQALDPVLVLAAEVAYRSGDEAAAHGLLEEFRSTERIVGTQVVPGALLFHDLGHQSVIAEWVQADVQTPWTKAALAIAEGDLTRAAEILEPTGARTFVVAVRLRAAQKAASEGRRAEAAEQLAPALAFYREVEATAYVREAEALLPAAS